MTAIVVAGVPIGDQEYVRVHLAKTASATKSKIETISSKLRAESVQALHVLNIFCLQPIFTYWTQHVYPSDVVEPNRRYPRAEAPAWNSTGVRWGEGSARWMASRRK